MTSQHVLVADDHPLTCEGLALGVRAALPGISIDTAGTIEEAERVIARRRTGYRLVLLDLVLPDARGFSGLLRLQHLLNATPIAIVSAHRDPGFVEAARALDAVAFLPKTLPLDDMAAAIRMIASGRSVFPSPGEPGPATPARDRLATLSGAQLRVLLSLADGKLNKQIAADLDIAEATVKVHLTSIFRKLGVANRAQALLAVQPLLGAVERP